MTATGPLVRVLNPSRDRIGGAPATMPERYDHGQARWLDATDPDDARDERDFNHDPAVPYRFQPSNNPNTPNVGRVIDPRTNQIIEDRITFERARTIWLDLQA